MEIFYFELEDLDGGELLDGLTEIWKYFFIDVLITVQAIMCGVKVGESFRAVVKNQDVEFCLPFAIIKNVYVF